jgi:hypothetical protein
MNTQGKLKGCKGLLVWQKSMALVKGVGSTLPGLPRWRQLGSMLRH